MEQITEAINNYNVMELKNFLNFMKKDGIINMDETEMQTLINKFKNGNNVEEVQDNELFEQPQDEYIECEYILQMGKNKGSVCGKKCKVSDMPRCNSHLDRKNKVKCNIILQKGKNKGTECGKIALNGKNICKAHNEKEETDLNEVSDLDEQPIFKFDSQLEKELFGSDSDEDVVNDFIN